MSATRLRTLAALVFSSVLLLACSGLFSPDGPEIAISADLDRAVAEPPVVRMDIGGKRVTVSPATDEMPARSREIRGPRYGAVPVLVSLIGADGDSLAAVAFTHHLARDNDHWVSAIIGLHRPGGFCLGSLALKPLRANAFPESSATPDTLFVVYGGIPKGAIC